KTGLFMLADGWGGSLERLTGGAKRSPVGAALFTLFALSLVGVPPLPGFWAKFTLITELAAQSGPLYLIGLLVFLLATVIETSYLFRIVAKLYSSAGTTTEQPEQQHLPGLSLATASLFGITLLAATVLIAPIGDGLQAVAAEAKNAELYIQTVMPVTPGGQL
ncbi:MAG: proton-conducting transporter membrane subunit, partial [Candidatus Thiodiazotropha taylori]|nr:NADH-quinone oxidoreductase subunit J [Candidatus Thiodiazotropha taylori]MCW4251921.1 proton-conducting transporter membrane subunit [Candidatus Thiodiazotropha taylori]